LISVKYPRCSKKKNNTWFTAMTTDETTIKIAFFSKSKLGEALDWNPTAEEQARTVFDQLGEWTKSRQQFREAMAAVGFPVDDLSSGNYEYGTKNRRRKAREPLYRWRAITEEDSMSDLIDHGNSVQAINLRVKKPLLDSGSSLDKTQQEATDSSTDESTNKRARPAEKEEDEEANKKIRLADECEALTQSVPVIIVTPDAGEDEVRDPVGIINDASAGATTTTINEEAGIEVPNEA
jgi:hypothetical protein